MEKTLLIQGLRTRVGEDDAKLISDKTFDGIATEVLGSFADDDKITDDTWKLPVTLLKQFAGQKRHDEAAFAQQFKTDYAAQHEKDVEERIKKSTAEAIEQYKKEHPELKPDTKETKVVDKDIDTKVAAAVAEAMKGLIAEEGAIGKTLKTITDFTARQSERDKQVKLAAVREQLKQHLVGLKANEEACIEDALDDLDYGDDPKFSDLKQKCIDAYEKRYKRYYGNGTQPFGGNGSGAGPGGKDSSFVKQRIEALKKEAEEQQNYAKELEQGFK